MKKERKEFGFIAHRKIFFGISIALLLFGLLFNILFGVEMDIDFKGGTLIRYSYQGNIDKTELDSFIDTQLDKNVDVQFSTSSDGKDNSFEIPLVDALTLDEQEALDSALTEKYADNSLAQLTAQAVSPTMGRMFFIKCLVAIGLASLFLVIYVAFRFRKIGGLSAGVMALVALLHDVLIAYFTFVVFRIPLDDNFVAVVLSILGYSLNATIVIYDRVRENRRIMSSDCTIGEIVNRSINQSFTRTLNTSLCTFAAIAVVAVLALVYQLDSIVSFALPMMVGVVSGFYSSTFIAGPLWVLWKEHRVKNGDVKAEKGKKAKA